jgi:hypothetical protein
MTPDRICSSIASIRRHAPLRRPGYESALLAASLPGSPAGCACWTAETYLRLKSQYTLPPLTIPQLASNFGKATLRWARAGFPVVNKQEWTHRLETCRSCPAWSEDARRGLGKCAMCYCTKAKHFLATETCPLKKW